MEMGQSAGRDLTFFHRFDEGASGLMVVAAVAETTVSQIGPEFTKSPFQLSPVEAAEAEAAYPR